MSEMKDDSMSDEPRPDPGAVPVTPAPDTRPPRRSAPVQPSRPAAAGATAAAGPAAVGLDPKSQQKVRFDSANIKSSYCNVCNATSTREEVVINFGVNKNWDMGGADLEVQLEHRIILSPYAAKRLQDLLVRLIGDHEKRYGKLN
jgi:hypothetical protein